MLDHLRIKLLISGNKPHVGHHFCSEILYEERRALEQQERTALNQEPGDVFQD